MYLHDEERHVKNLQVLICLRDLLDFFYVINCGKHTREKERKRKKGVVIVIVRQNYLFILMDSDCAARKRIHKLESRLKFQFFMNFF